MELDGNPGTGELVHQIKQESQVPIIALVSRETLDSVDGNLPVDDFTRKLYKEDCLKK